MQPSTQHKLNAFVNEIASFVNANGLDGVDIDWERPGVDSNGDPLPSVQDQIKEWNQCIALLAALKSSLPNKRITIALPHGNWFFPNPTIQLDIWDTADLIYLMTYDVEDGVDGWPNHSNTNYSIGGIDNWITGGTPISYRNKLFLGCAFYGYKKDSNGNTIWGDGDKKVSYATYSGGGNYNRGDLPADVRNKAIRTRDNGFGGVFIWELGYDVPADQSNSLLKAIYEVMPYVSGTSTVCNSNTTFTLNNPPPGSTLSWSKSNNLAYVNVVGTGSYTVKAATASTSGNGWVEVTLNSPYGNDTLPRRNVWVGKPTLPTVNPSKGIEMTTADDLLLTLTNTPGASSSSGQWSASCFIPHLLIIHNRKCVLFLC